MDLVHAHYVKNLNEGINELDGTDHLYSLPGTAGEQPYWDSKTFDYGKEQVRHFLLSNVKYWLDEFHFDGYRFDGVTSMLYRHHGHTDFVRREQYFDEEVDEAALTYLTLANTLVHDFRPQSVTIAEEVSGMPGIAVPTADGGVGFDYRLGMAIPDFWIRQLKEIPDEQWDIHAIWHVLTDRLPGIKTVAYAESHDQALVGDQTLAFRLMGKEMYDHMDRASQSPVIDRGMALHKMIRLVTISAGGDAYLNFMGNEFGHPEWIDFPREGNGWSYAYARRQWSLADNGLLRYAQLGEFDRAMIALVKNTAYSATATLTIYRWTPRIRRWPFRTATCCSYSTGIRRPRYPITKYGCGFRAVTARSSRPTSAVSAARSGPTCGGSISPTPCRGTSCPASASTTPRARRRFPPRRVKETISRPHRAVGKRLFPARPSYREIRDSEADEAYQETKTSKNDDTPLPSGVSDNKFNTMTKNTDICCSTSTARSQTRWRASPVRYNTPCGISVSK